MRTIVLLVLVTVLSFSAWLIPVRQEMVLMPTDFEADLQRYDDIMNEIIESDKFEEYKKGGITEDELLEMNSADIAQIDIMMLSLTSFEPPNDYKERYVEIFDQMRHYKSYLLYMNDYVMMPDGDERNERYQFMQTHQRLGTK